METKVKGTGWPSLVKSSEAQGQIHGSIFFRSGNAIHSYLTGIIAEKALLLSRFHISLLSSTTEK
jgi:hypothetical protein